jgi:hypothetical protein
MLGEIALTIGLPFCTVGVCLAVMGVISLFKRRRRRRAIERGVKDFVNQVRDIKPPQSRIRPLNFDG